jgi:hypothetical protein
VPLVPGTPQKVMLSSNDHMCTVSVVFAVGIVTQRDARIGKAVLAVAVSA